MAIVTLISDWKNDDFYIGAVKGLLYSKCSDINVVDITHKIDTFKYTHAAFVLRNAFAFYPKGTIHIVGVNSIPSDKHPPICLKINDHIFLGAASGIFSLMFEGKPQELVAIEENETFRNSSFPELTIYAEVAAYLVNGGSIAELGPAMTEKPRYVQLIPTFEENYIIGSVTYIDSYGNLFTNIDIELFEQVRKKRNFIITVKSNSYSIDKLSRNYIDVPKGEILALFNSLGLLEIAQNSGNLAELIDVNINATVNIKFK